MNPQLSVVVRCRNEAQSLREVLAALRAQITSFAWEIVIVDNESEDETSQVCAQHSAAVVSIGRDEFSYGRALNRGIEAARGELILVLSAHSLPVGSSFLELAAAPFKRDDRLAAVRCLGLSSADQIRRWYLPRDLEFSDNGEQARFEREEDWLRLYPAATCAVLRRSVWQEVRFDESLQANEDKLWASAVLARGYRVRACGEAVFMYIKLMDWRETLAREHKQDLALYRLRRKEALSAGGYLAALPKIFFNAARVGIHEVRVELSRYTNRLLLPVRARHRPTSGSFAEFNRKP